MRSAALGRTIGVRVWEPVKQGPAPVNNCRLQLVAAGP